MTYKQVRISEEYLEKLRQLSDKQKRSMTKVLEVLIDGSTTTISSDHSPVVTLSKEYKADKEAS